MIVLADYHNGALYESLRILIEDRFGGELYRPIGLEWYDEGFFKIAEPYGNSPETIKQYLSTENVPYDSYAALNGGYYFENGIYYIKDHYQNTWHKAISLNKFKELQPDVIIASIPAHEDAFTKLRDKYAPGAKVVAQMGNIGQEPTGIVPNILDSTDTYHGDLHHVSYHQEFKLEYDPSATPAKLISSFLHLNPIKEGKPYWDALKNALNDYLATGYKFNEWGVGGEKGPIQTQKALMEEMKGSKFIFHAKKEGDGYGHVFHNAYSLGRPVITFGSATVGRQTGKLFEHGVTGIDLEQPDWIEVVKHFGDKDKVWQTMSDAAKKRFDEVVNFDLEEPKLKQFFAELV